MKILFEAANKNGISLSENQLEKFKIYMDFLINIQTKHKKKDKTLVYNNK